MSTKKIVLILLLGLFGICHGRYGFRGDQEWGFVTVRPGANLFYWLHYTTAKVDSYIKKPLLIWLEGGPGVSSTGYTNFNEIGPLQLNLSKRTDSLVEDYNVLFIDSPVGTGFSYVDSKKDHAKSDKQVALDLLSFIEKFFKKFPTFNQVPTYIIGQCYGGKTAVLFAYEWLQKVGSGWNTTNLKGVGLADAWISPLDYILTWAPYLYHNGLIDTEGYEAIIYYAHLIKDNVKAKDWKGAQKNVQYTIKVVRNYTGNVNFYNILSKINHEHVSHYVKDEEAIKKLMESEVKVALNLPKNRNFNIDINDVYTSLLGKLIKPVTKTVEYLLNQSNIKVFVFNGQLDLLVDTPGTLHWIENLKWKNSSKWLSAARKPLMINNFIEGYVKTYGNLGMYWINRSGHVITIDNPAAARKVLKDLTNDAYSN